MTLSSGIGDFEIGRKRKRTSHRGGRERAKTSDGEGGGKRERTRKGHGVPYTLVSAEEDEEKRVGGVLVREQRGQCTRSRRDARIPCAFALFQHRRRSPRNLD